jgi:hypothetical protein
MLEQNIKCANFCPYNKKLFCPFWVDYKEELIKPSDEPDVIPNKIKSKKQSIKPLTFKRKKKTNSDNDNNNDDNNKGEPQWMKFTGSLIIQNFFECNFIGTMTDFQLGEFSSTVLPKNDEDNFSQIYLTGQMQTNNKTCDFGGKIEINIELKLKDNKTQSITLLGDFETYYKSGGTVQEEDNKTEEDNETNENEPDNETEEVVSMKFYEGGVEFNQGYNGTIKFYTSM